MVVASSMLLFVVVLLSHSFCGHALPALAELDPELRAVDLQSYDPSHPHPVIAPQPQFLHFRHHTKPINVRPMMASWHPFALFRAHLLPLTRASWPPCAG